MKKLALIVLLMSCLLLIVGCKDKKEDPKKTTSSTTTTATTTKKGDQDPPVVNPPDEGSADSTITLDKIRVQLLSDSLVRLEIKGPKGFEDRASYTVSNRTNWEKIDYTQATEGDFNVIATSAYKIYIPKDAKTLKGAYITDTKGSELWHYESDTNSNVYMPSPSDELNSWYFTDAPRIIPSEAGYSVVEDYKSKNGWDSSNDATDTFVFLPQGSYENFTSEFIKLTGSSELVTMKMLGYWDSRWFAYTSETALQQIQDYLDKGYSIDVLVIDTDWRTTENGVGYTINKQLFPDMAEFLDKAHEMGVDIMFNDHPEPVEGTNNLLDKKEIEYRSNNLKLILSLGLDYWWYDRNWHVALKPIDNDISIYASGMYAFQFVTEEYYESITDPEEYARRALIMANVDGILNGVLQYAPELSAHRYSIQWTGDIDCDVSDLEDEIFNAVYGGAELGIPYVSADIGGHRSEVSDDMYVRWMQFGALSPICRVHCTKPYSRMPWLYGETAEKVTHQYVDMRYRLLPLYYSLANENYETGLPLLRRLDIAFPEYSEADANDEYLLGDTILVAPLAESYAHSTDTYFTSNGQEGLYGEYFSNKNLSGTPTVTKYDKDIYFDWAQGAPAGISVTDNFSIRWTGEVHVGADDLILRVYADDGVRIWIDDKKVIDGWTVYDQFLASEPLEAGSVHTIKIEYFDSGSYAHIYMNKLTNKGVSREVFLPDGEWMDIWSGKTYVGPATITVTHTLETSPIFVRMGSAIAMADNMKNTDEKDWSHLTLDVFPSISFDSSFTLYEDDRETVAYKDGKYRKTEITMSGEGTNIEIKIPAAVGTFTGKHAFTDRSWTVRVHGREGWGELTSATLNGKAVTFTKIARDANADPLATVGACRDNDVYEFKFDAKVTDNSVIVLTFASTKADGKNESYDDSAANFTVQVDTLKKANVKLNLTEHGNKDWAIFGAYDVSSVVRKNTAEHLIGTLGGIGGRYSFTDNYSISWNDGDIRVNGSSTNGPVSNHTIETTLKTGPDKTHYEIYLGGYKSIAKITIRDRAGNVKTYTFGDLKTNYYRMIAIDVTSEVESELYICYSMLSGDNITFSAITASDGTLDEVDPGETPESPATADVSYEGSYTTKLDLTANGTKYWEFYGTIDGQSTNEQCKANASDIITTTFNQSQAHYDNKAEVTWSDGKSVASHTTRHGINSPNDISVTVNTEGCSEVKFLVGAWNATNQMTVYDANNIPLESITLITAGGDASMALVTIDLSKYEGDTITVIFTATNKNGGNVSLTAVTVK